MILLDLTRVSTGKIELHQRRVDVRFDRAGRARSRAPIFIGKVDHQY